MIKPLKIPRGIGNIFVLGNSADISIIEKWKHRPDKILEVIGQSSMKKEVLNNYMSNTSPISLKNGDTYTVTDELFEGYFLNGSR